MAHLHLRSWLGHLRRNPLVNLLNLAALTIGMSALLLAGLYVQREFRVDSHQPEETVRIWFEARIGEGNELVIPSAASSLGPVMDGRLDGIEAWTRFWIISRAEPVRHGNRVFLEDNVAWADSGLFRTLHLPLVQGDPETALNEPQSVVLSEEAAEKYFGGENPMGGEILFNNRYRYKVTGVFHNPPGGTHLPEMQIIASFSSLDLPWLGDDVSFLNNMATPTYFRLAPGVDRERLEEEFNRILTEREGAMLEAVGGTARVHLQPIREAYLFSPDFMYGNETHGSLEQVLQIGLIGLLALLVAAINYVNLTTAVGARRARNVGVAKALGASRAQLARQYLLESVALAVGALLLALLAVQLLLPGFEQLAGRELGSPPLQRPEHLPLLLAGAVGVGVLAGLYPALRLAAFDPVKVLKGQLSSGRRAGRLRSVLVVVQFVVSVVLIASTLVIYQQMEYMRAKRLGYAQERVLFLPLADDQLRDQYETLRERIGGLPGVQHAVGTHSMPHYSVGQRVLHLPGRSAGEGDVSVRYMVVEPGYLELMGMELAEGRDFSVERSTDPEEALLVNREAVRRFGWERGVGSVLERTVEVDPVRHEPMQVVGVVEDFHYETMHEPIQPLLLQMLTGVPEMLALRLAPGDPRAALEEVKRVWSELSPNAVFDYTFLSQRFDRLYRKEIRQGRLFAIFASVAILIACLGLLALAAFAAAARTKEIGVRKVMGARESSLVLLLVRQFLLLVLVANAVALPLAWWLMERWLEGFAYRIQPGVPLFALAALISLLVALATVIGQAVRAATTNPVNALRYE